MRYLNPSFLADGFVSLIHSLELLVAFIAWAELGNDGIHLCLRQADVGCDGLKDIDLPLMPEVFTMPQLQGLYEAVLGVRFDRRNFSSKMLKLGILTQVDDGTVRKGTRNPIKYSFNKESYEQMKAKGYRLEF